MGVNQLQGLNKVHMENRQPTVSNKRQTWCGPDILDPFVTAKLGKSALKETKAVHDGGAFCKFTEADDNTMVFPFDATGPDETEQLDLVITCMDEDTLDSDVIGAVTVSLSEYCAANKLKNALQLPVKLGGKFTGILHASIEITFGNGRVPEGDNIPAGEVKLTIKEVEDLVTAGSMVVSDDATFLGFLTNLIVLSLYIAGYSTFFHYMEGWTWSEGAYFSIVTFSTVGFGDLSPETDNGKWFIIIAGVFGVAVGGVCLNNLLSWFIAMYFRAVVNIKKILARKRKKALKAAKAKSNKVSIVPDDAHHEKLAADMDKMRKSRHISKNLSSALLNLFGMVLVVLALWVGGAYFFMHVEGWGLVDSLYMCMVTLLTIGYGDFSPVTDIGRYFCCIWLCFGFTFMARMLSTMSETYVHWSTARARKRVLNQHISKVTILNMDEDGNGELDRIEFLINMMMMLGMCERKEIDMILARFDLYEEHRAEGSQSSHDAFSRLDVDGDGKLSHEEFRKASKKERAELTRSFGGKR